MIASISNDQEISDLISRTLLFMEANFKMEIWRQGKHYKRDLFVDYLNNIHELGIKHANHLGKIIEQTQDTKGFYLKNREKLNNIIHEEKDKIISSLFLKGQFSDIDYSFNFESAFAFIDEAVEAERCIFWNTYLDLNQWHSPLIRMHLSIQKSIEQKSNFASIHKCHIIPIEDKSKNEAVKSCLFFPPVYRHYRILILPLTDKELKEKLSDKSGSFYKNLKFSTLIHCTLSFQLAVLTTTQLGKIIMNEKSDFFKNETNLISLGLSPTLVSINKDGRGILNREFENTLKANIEELRKTPDFEKEDGLDFTHIVRNPIVNDRKDFWSACDDKEKGLTYYNFKDENINRVKQEFSNIVFQKITEETNPTDLSFMKLDPLYPFYQEYKRSFLNFKYGYNAKLMVDLNLW